MKRNLISTLYACCLLLYSTACVSEKKNSSSSEKNSIVELTPEFILAVQKYDALGEFCEGLAPVGLEKDGNLLWGYINTKGEEVISCTIKASIVGCFSEGLACIIDDEKYLFVNRDGKNVFTIDGLSKGLLEIIPPSEEICYEVIQKSTIPYFKNGECGLLFHDVLNDTDKIIYIDKNGKTLREETMKTDSSNLIKSRFNTFSEGDGYNCIGLKDENGNVVIPAKYNDIIIGDEESGVFLATIADNGGDDGLMPVWYVGYVDLKGNDTFPEQIKKQIQRFDEHREKTNPSALDKAMQNAKWIESEQGFKYPDIMQETKVQVEEYGYIDSYSWGSVELCSFYGPSWVTYDAENGDFPAKGSIIVPNTRVKEINYTSRKHNIFSGYLTDGRIFYLKYIIPIDPNAGVIHTSVLSLAYPKEFQKEVEPLIEEVRKWHIH
ncbi:MAG: WG repeat-containing protein [Prevotella sp.]|nr:WG repeat-containing protein [Prevotella sp.]